VDQLQPLAGDLAGVPTLPHYNIELAIDLRKKTRREATHAASDENETKAR
jgi:hypothetical protein